MAENEAASAPERLTREAFGLLRAAQKVYELAERDGYLHPAQTEELVNQYLRFLGAAGEAWMVRSELWGRQ